MSRKLVEITPHGMRCGLGLCPSIFRDEDGNYVLIGKETRGRVPAERVGSDETVISIPKELLADLLAQSNNPSA